jgi:hypothetical protein
MLQEGASIADRGTWRKTHPERPRKEKAKRGRREMREKRPRRMPSGRRPSPVLHMRYLKTLKAIE